MLGRTHNVSHDGVHHRCQSCHSRICWFSTRPDHSRDNFGFGIRLLADGFVRKSADCCRALHGRKRFYRFRTCGNGNRLATTFRRRFLERHRLPRIVIVSTSTVACQFDLAKFKTQFCCRHRIVSHLHRFISGWYRH